MILSDSFKFLPKGVNIRVAPTKNPRNNELRKRHNRVHSVNHHKAKTNTANTTPTPTLVNISPERKKKRELHLYFTSQLVREIQHSDHMNISVNNNINNDRLVKELFACEQRFNAFQPTRWFRNFGRYGTGEGDLVITLNPLGGCVGRSFDCSTI